MMFAVYRLMLDNKVGYNSIIRLSLNLNITNNSHYYEKDN